MIPRVSADHSGRALPGCDWSAGPRVDLTTMGQLRIDRSPRPNYFDRAIAVNPACRRLRQAGTGGYSAGGVSVPTADSSAAATRYIRSSAIVGAITWKPTGSPSDSPHGTEIAGPPYRLVGMV